MKRVVVALALLGAACAREVPAPLASRPPSAPSTPLAPSTTPLAATLPPVPSPTGPVDTFLGAFGHVAWRSFRDGYLRIAVERVRNANGTVVTTATYERNKDCGTDGDLFACQQVWRVEHRIANAAFVIDATLRHVTLTDTLRGQPLHVMWEPYGRPRTSVMENGSLYTEMRDAIGDATWGPMHYVERADKAPGMLYRRIAAAS